MAFSHVWSAFPWRRSSASRSAVAIVFLAGLASYGNTGGCGDRKTESCFGVLTARPALRVCCCCSLVRLSALSGGARTSRHLYIQYRHVTRGSFVNDFQIPFCNFDYLPVLQQGVYHAFFGPRVFHLWVLLHGLKAFHVGGCEVFDYTSSAPLQ